MLCSPCTTTKTLADCFENLIVGTVGAANTDYYIYIKNNTTGRIERYTAISNGASLLVLANGNYFAQNHSYELSVTLKSAASPDELQDVIVSGDTDPHKCFALRFEPTFTDGDKNDFTTLTLKVA